VRNFKAKKISINISFINWSILAGGAALDKTSKAIQLRESYNEKFEVCHNERKGYDLIVTKSQNLKNITLELIMPSPEGINLLNYIAFVSANLIAIKII
jgi:hypothetical protein